MQRWNHGAARGVPPLPEHARVRLGRARASARWFIPDGIHYYSPGYVARDARASPRASSHAFPDGQPPSASCLVR